MSRANAFACLDSDDEEPVRAKAPKTKAAAAPKPQTEQKRGPRQERRGGRGNAGRGNASRGRGGRGYSSNDGVSERKYGRDRYERRGGKGRGAGKGRGGKGRDGRNFESRGRNSYEKREQDRGEAKKGGHGRGGWGSEKDQVKQATEDAKDPAEGDADIENLMNAEEEPETPELSLKAYAAEQKAKKAAFLAKYGKKSNVTKKDAFAGKVVGKANTGSNFSSSSWGGAKKTSKVAVQNKDLRAMLFAEPSHNFDTSDREDRPKGKGRGKGRGGKGKGRGGKGKGRGGGRGGNVKSRGNKALNTSSTSDFPPLG